MTQPHKLFVITGPSGVGKTYLGHILSETYPNNFEIAKLFTTRELRPDENYPDRISVSKEEFLRRRNKNEFSVCESFHDNMYGYPNAIFQPNNKHHLIVNTWPSIVPQFLQYPQVVVVALTANISSYSLLEKRMLNRGDSSEVVKQRMVIVQKDADDIKQLTNTINSRGKVFEINNDEIISKQVLPWLLEQIE